MNLTASLKMPTLLSQEDYISPSKSQKHGRVRSKNQAIGVWVPKEFRKPQGFRKTVVISNDQIPVGGQTLLLPDVLFLVESGPVNSR